MPGIYIHIPFCKQACTYCDFHFSTSLGKKEAMLAALQKELTLRKDEFKEQVVETIYFGGGTPSVLETDEIRQIIATVYTNYAVTENPEITLEANPDDLSSDTLVQLTDSAINRLSLGIQSFFEEDLKFMNRAHTSSQAVESLTQATKYFENLSIDLIYGIQGMSNERWKQNIKKALSFNIPHISSYALTVEPKTALAGYIKKGLVKPVDDEATQEQHAILVELLEAEGFVNYEISNFGKPGFFSRNNTAYWQQKKYLGIGPSAHSYDGFRRGWNVANNAKYLKAIEQDRLPLEIELLTKTNRYNEYIMTGLRTIWGVSYTRIASEFGTEILTHLKKESHKHIERGFLKSEGDLLLTTKKGRFLADGIAADLFLVD
jgi:oxygen-independent coproporphyrinogen-3 oxidase